MEWWEAFWLGLTQGITEFINFGTLLALVIYYRKRIWQILKDVFVKTRPRARDKYRVFRLSYRAFC